MIKYKWKKRPPERWLRSKKGFCRKQCCGPFAFYWFWPDPRLSCIKFFIFMVLMWYISVWGKILRLRINGLLHVWILEKWTQVNSHSYLPGHRWRDQSDHNHNSCSFSENRIEVYPCSIKNNLPTLQSGGNLYFVFSPLAPLYIWKLGWVKSLVLA